MEPPVTSGDPGSRGNPPIQPSLDAYNAELVRRAELEAELRIRRANSQRLQQDVGALAKEVEMDRLVEKWEQTPRGAGEERSRPEIEAAALCDEITSNPEALDDVLMKLHYQKAKLQSEVAEVMSELKQYKVLE